MQPPILSFQADDTQDVQKRRWQWWLRLAQAKIWVFDLYQHTQWSSQFNTTSTGNSGQEVVRTAFGTCTRMPSDSRIQIANNSKILRDRLAVVFPPWTLNQNVMHKYRHGKVPQQIRSIKLAQENQLFQ